MRHCLRPERFRWDPVQTDLLTCLSAGERRRQCRLRVSAPDADRHQRHPAARTCRYHANAHARLLRQPGDAIVPRPEPGAVRTALVQRQQTARQHAPLQVVALAN